MAVGIRIILNITISLEGKEVIPFMDRRLPSSKEKYKTSRVLKCQQNVVCVPLLLLS